MPNTPPTIRKAKQRERDRASNVVRVEERLPRDMVEQLKQYATELRKKAESQNEGEAET